MQNVRQSFLHTGRMGRVGILVWCCIVWSAHVALTQNLWEIFSRSYTTNVLAWTRHNGNPVIGPSGSTWKSLGTADPEFLTFQNRTLLYYCGTGILPGQGKSAHDRIGVAEIRDVGPMRLTYHDLNRGSPVLDLGLPGEFDGEGIRSPATVVFRGILHLYYSASGKGPNSIGLAVSTDGEQFTKLGKVLEGEAPDVLIARDTLFMVYQKRDQSGYKVFLAFSTDGRTFTPAGLQPVLEGAAGRWDAKSVLTPRVWFFNDVFYMLYGGSTDFMDEPEFFGLARSKDLRTWETHPGNPIFGAGLHGTADGGAIRSPAITESGGWIVMLYEGSRGKQSWDQLLSICMAWIAKR